ncbi:Uncharacterised protein [Corynebacterium diphtheriae]|nr:hypothetical protein CDIPH_09790 [Corynebacterium diphtheriae]CAB0618086.1 hypothetical protein CIP107542_02029 [Corynebacterium diphtheriae]CAB1009290.1 hypothetical protein FRC0490_02029 [Corynebacterium diphtheriae]CAB1052100.1 hypothetical protein NCTC11397BIS_02032 [Corynebacterium diphtheriae]CKH14862.1 Uncharacterised protein [Corynebacterium diphtheriae]
MGVWPPFTPPVGVLNDAAAAVNAANPAEAEALIKELDRECPIVCVRGLGLQVVRESVGVSHG